MDHFTYEEENRTLALETYEWDNVWWEHAPEADKPRVLLIGDSISCGYRTLVNQKLEGKIYADSFASSKALDNPQLLESLKLFMAQQSRCDLIHINNGLHGWHLSEAAYKTCYIELIGALRALCPNTPIVIALTTPVRVKGDLEKLDARNTRVLARNAAAREVAAQFDLPVNDLYAVSDTHPEYYRPDGVHQFENGYTALAEQIVKVIRQSIE